MTKQQALHAAKILTAYANGMQLQMKGTHGYVDVFDKMELFRFNPDYSEFRIAENKWIAGDKPSEDGMYYVCRYNILYRSTNFLSRCRFQDGKWVTWATKSKIVAYMPYTDLFIPKPLPVRR